MATYKVIQDIEAEDKLLGPLSLRQFIYALIVCVMGFIAFKLAVIKWYLALPFILPMGFFALLAAPFGHDQSSEIWLLAKIRFMFKPRKRIWDQTGMQELVTITVPKKLERQLTNSLSPYEVRSRLQALANTLDSRGWAIKNVNINLYGQPSYLTVDSPDSDRLIDPDSLPQNVPSYDITSSDDIFEDNSAAASHFSELIDKSEHEHKKKVVASMHNNTTASNQPVDFWFLNETPTATNSDLATFNTSPVVGPGTTPSDRQQAQTAEEEGLLRKIHEDQAKSDTSLGRLHRLDTPAEQHAKDKTKQSEQTKKKMTATPDPAILGMALNDDLNVSTIARQVNRARDDEPPEDEVVISLH